MEENNILVQPQRTRCEVWTRVMGYFRPLSHFNIGKKSEAVSRRYFDETMVANKEFNNEFSCTSCS